MNADLSLDTIAKLRAGAVEASAGWTADKIPAEHALRCSTDMFVALCDMAARQTSVPKEVQRQRFEKFFKMAYPLQVNRADTTLKHQLWTAWQVALDGK